MKYVRHLLFAVIALSLVSCGGGGGDSAPQVVEMVTSPVPDSPESIELPSINATAQLDAQQTLEKLCEANVDYAVRRNPTGGYPVNDGGTNIWQQYPFRWTSGFFPGILWGCYTYSGDNTAATQAIRWTAGLASQVDWRGHDVGFMINSSFGRQNEIASDSSDSAAVIAGADNLVTQYSETVMAIRSWPDYDRYAVIIDNMMNIELLFRAFELTGEQVYFDIAYSHAMTTAKHFIRENGGSYHMVQFDESNGNVHAKRTIQGLADNSTWSRGQAWAIYGFALAYDRTQDPMFLSTLKFVTKYFVESLPDSLVAPWDFDSTDGIVDTSANVIAAAGLLRFQPQDEELASIGQALLNAVLTPEYIELSGTGPTLLKSSGNVPGDFEIEVSLIYGDYYLQEALLFSLGLNIGSFE